MLRDEVERLGAFPAPGRLELVGARCRPAPVVFVDDVDDVALESVRRDGCGYC